MDTNDAEWYSYISLDTDYTTIKLPFELFQIDKSIKIKQTKSIDLERIKCIEFTMEGTLKSECGDIYIKNIRVY